MELYLVKPDLYFFEAYNAMMAEWIESGTQIAPWFLGKPFPDLEAFGNFIRMLDDCEHGRVDQRYAATSSFFVVDEAGKLVGATSLRHYLTPQGLRTWGHIGYGVRPSRRLQGYGTRMLQLMLEEAKRRNIRRILLGCHTSNLGSAQVIRRCGGQLEDIVDDPDAPGETISRYWIHNR